jgi:hypothetical protein
VDEPAGRSNSLAIGFSAPALVFADNCGVGHSGVFEFEVSAPLAAPIIANASTKETPADLFMF